MVGDGVIEERFCVANTPVVNKFLHELLLLDSCPLPMLCSTVMTNAAAAALSSSQELHLQPGGRWSRAGRHCPGHHRRVQLRPSQARLNGVTGWCDRPREV